MVNILRQCIVELRKYVFHEQSYFTLRTWRHRYSNKFRSINPDIISGKCDDTTNIKIFNPVSFDHRCFCRCSSLNWILLSIHLLQHLFSSIPEKAIQTNHTFDTVCNRFTTPYTCYHLCLVFTHSFE